MITYAKEWAYETFKASDLGDVRRTNRLIKLAGSYAKHIGFSTVESCGGDVAQVEGAYRFLRNEEIKPEQIREGGFVSSVHLASKESTLLAIEDTTTLSYKHKAAGALGYTSNSPTAKSRGFNVFFES
jgi:hypothetical protein